MKYKRKNAEFGIVTSIKSWKRNQGSRKGFSGRQGTGKLISYKENKTGSK
jgi:hypothetical protein